MLRIEFLNERDAPSQFIAVLSAGNISFFGCGPKVALPSLKLIRELPKAAQEFLRELPRDKYQCSTDNDDEDPTLEILLPAKPIAPQPPAELAAALEKTLLEKLKK